MKIEVAIDKTKIGYNEKQRGDLLEDLAEKLLSTKHYEVIKEVAKTGTEIDLVCRDKANYAKCVYVECKAMSTNVGAEIIHKLIGVRHANRKEYQEAWLITTLYTFYTPTKLIELLISAKSIINEDIIPHKLGEKIKFDAKKFNKNYIFLITEYGYFWAVKYLTGGKDSGVILLHAEDGEIVEEKEMLDNIYSTDTSLKELDFGCINTLQGLKSNADVVGIENIKISLSYLKKINDIGVKFTHPNKNELTLRDIFVFPDLKLSGDEDKKIINSQELVMLKNDFKKVLIFGEDVSGKTSLAYKLQDDLNNQNYIPLYIDAEDIKKTDTAFLNKLLLNTFSEQFEETEQKITFFKSLLKTDTSKIVIIIDNLEKVGLKNMKAKEVFFGLLNEMFENIFIFVNKSQEMEVIAKKEYKDMFKDFNILSIKQLGYLLRDVLIEKWITLGKEDALLDDEEILNRKREISGKIKIAVGTNFIPTYPLYIVTMLQVFETGNKHSLQGSSYAELYRFLIVQNLTSASVKPEDIHFYHTYLSHIAYQFYLKEDTKELSEKEIRETYKQYALDMDLSNSFEGVHDILLDTKILKKEDGSYKYTHNYSYYFYVSLFFSNNLDDKTIEDTVVLISQRLYRSEYANIIVFLIHHTKNKEVIERILKEAKSLFSKITPYSFSPEETQKINKLIKKESKVLIEDINPREIRAKELTHRDQNEESSIKNNDPKCENVTDLDLFGQINLAFKLMEILGQVANNHYGSLKSLEKVEILSEVYSLGFRSLKTLIEDFEKYQDGLKEEIQNIIEKKNAITPDLKEKVANKILFEFVEMFSMVFLKKTSDSMASKNLTVSIDKVVESNGSFASRLVGIATELNFPNGLDSKKIVTLWNDFDGNFLLNGLLKWLVIDHLYKFDVNYADKQSICSKLEISIKTQRAMLKNKGR